MVNDILIKSINSYSCLLYNDYYMVDKLIPYYFLKFLLLEIKNKKISKYKYIKKLIFNKCYFYININIILNSKKIYITLFIII